MTRWIMLADVRFGLDDDPARNTVVSSTLDHCAEHFARDDFGFAVVEGARKNARHAMRRAPRFRAGLDHFRKRSLLATSPQSSFDRELSSRRPLVEQARQQ
jgi:hypothetical protein